MAEALSARVVFFGNREDDEIVANGNIAVAKLLQFFADSHDPMVIRITSTELEKISLSRADGKLLIHIGH